MERNGELMTTMDIEIRVHKSIRKFFNSLHYAGAGLRNIANTII
jgi:hypothetical protein